MPNMVNIVVKKADGTTDITYGAINPSGGDATWAFWRETTALAILSANPNLSLMSKWNAQKTVRRLEGKYLYPYYVTDTTTGITSVKNAISLGFTWQVPQDVPAAFINEGIAQGSNLVASSLMKICGIAGWAPQ